MKILITGHLGFIGSRLWDRLKFNKDVEVVGYDLVDGDDIRDRIKLDKLFEEHNFDVVLHLAALAGVRRSQDFPDEYITTNITGTYNIVKACEKWGIKKLISFSSSSVLGGNYKSGEIIPTVIEDGLILKDDMYLLDEDHEYKPKSLYAQTKVTGELIALNSEIKEVFIVRPFTVYGQNGRPDMVIYKWINQIKSGKPITFFGDGKTARGYTHVDDLIDGVIAILNTDNSQEICRVREIYHLGGSEIITLNDLLEIFSSVCVKKHIDGKIERLPMLSADVVYSVADIRKAQKDLGYNPKGDFKKIVKSILIKEL